MKQATGGKYFLLYIPLLLSLALYANPIASYLTAWAGSFFIFYVSFTNKVKPTSPDVPFAEKILKPLFLMQIIFAGYMSCSSIFNFMDQMGYQYFTKIPGVQPDMDDIIQKAACQRFYCLGHAAMVHGILFFYKSDIQPKYRPAVRDWPGFFLKMVLICGPLGLALSKVPGFSVLGGGASGLALGAATIGFALSIPLKDRAKMMINGFFYVLSILQALTSGFKEPVIVSVLMLGIFLLPFYKKTILITFVPILLFLFAVLPTYVNAFRHQAWGADAADAETAKQEALKKVREDLANNDLAETNWSFLTGRITEIGLFQKYKESTEERDKHYGFTILGQTALSLIPRILWKGKPVTENMVMARVIENGVVSENANVSAKPQYIVDAYLSFGVVGIWIFMFLYGAIAQGINNKAEELFGGYFFGTAFIFTAMFRIMWRGNCWEFVFNDIFWSYIGMFIIFNIFKRTGVLEPVPQEEEAVSLAESPDELVLSQ